jgi:hypothetical protein
VYGYGEATVGLFGLVGVAGAVAAQFAGRVADAGWARVSTVGFFVALLASWAVLAQGERSLAALVVGIVVLDLAVQAGGTGCPAEPTAWLLAAVGVVLRRPTVFARSGRRGRGRRLWSEVAHDAVNHLADGAPGASQWCDREPHGRRGPGRPAGFPKGNLQVCARRICPSATTVVCQMRWLPGWPCGRWTLIVRWPGWGRGWVRRLAVGGRAAR